MVLADDLDGNGHMDLVVSTMNGNVYAFETPSDYHPLKAWPQQVGMHTHSSVHTHARTQCTRTHTHTYAHAHAHTHTRTRAHTQGFGGLGMPSRGSHESERYLETHSEFFKACRQS